MAIGANRNDGNGTDAGHVRIYSQNNVSFSQDKTYVPDDNFEAYLEANGMGDGIANNDSMHLHLSVM